MGKSKEKNIEATHGCTPKCFYFPQIEAVVAWEFGEDGLKHRVDKREFICGYDGHTIKNWTDKCPRKEIEGENK